MDNIPGIGQENLDRQSPRKRHRRESDDERVGKTAKRGSSSFRYDELIASLEAASSRVGKSTTRRFVETLIPNINNTNDADTPMIKSLYGRIEGDPKILERLLSLYYIFEMEVEFEKLDNGGHSRKHFRKRGWKEMIIGEVVKQGEHAEQNDEKLYALKCCRPQKRAKIVNQEDVRSLRGISSDPWLVKPNPNKNSKFDGVRVTKDDLYDMNLKGKRKRAQIIGYRYSTVADFNDGAIDGQYPAFHCEQMGTLWLLALFPTLTLNRNCYWSINSECKQECHEFGILRVETSAMKEGKAGYNAKWSDEILDSIGAQPHQRLTLKPRESGEACNPERIFMKYYAMLQAHWEKAGRPACGWILKDTLCEDYHQKNCRSNMYSYWQSLFGLSDEYKIGVLSQWRLEKLAEIEIYPNPNQAEMVKDELARQRQREEDEYTQRILACKEAAENAMADEVDESEEEEDDFFVGYS